MPPPRICAVCGEPAPPPFRPPPPEGAPDLDHRPGEPTRSTLPRWLATCRRCGATGPDLSALPAGAADMVRTDAYRALRGPDPAMPFLRWALICARSGDGAGGAEAVLQAAWATDDHGGDASALRRRAAGGLGGDPVRLIDVWRRAGAFEAAETQAALLAAGPLDENAARIVAFQRARIAERDIGRYLISSALRPPSHTPHASHGGAKAGSWWSRLWSN